MRLPTHLSLLLLFFVCTTVHAGSYLPVDSRLYDDFRFLEAEGVITTSQLATLPISRSEGLRLTREAVGSGREGSPRVEAILSRLQREFRRELDGDFAYLTPADTATVEFAYSDRQGFFAQKNRDGVEVRRGSNISTSLTSRFDSRYVSGVLRPELDLYEDATDFSFRKAYLLANIGREEFMFGKESAWWGPGQNGSTLLSTNAEPLTAFKISNSVPYFPFGVGVRGTFFITRLESDRTDVRRPILNGVRLDLKPAPWLEVGVSKTALYGGDERDDDPAAFLDSLLVIGENETGEPGDQRAGFDVKVVVPWQYQPVTLYLDAAGEDQRNRFPCKWFWLFGLYLPHVLSLDRLELMAEYANNNDSYYKGMWYTHHIYSQGYTYEGRILGHYIGSDAESLFLQARYHHETARFTLSYEQLRKKYPENYDWENYQATALADLSERTELAVSVGYAREAESNTLLRIGLKHQF